MRPQDGNVGDKQKKEGDGRRGKELSEVGLTVT